MKEIVNRLQENRQIDLAKSILESHGYKVTKPITEGVDVDYLMNNTIYSKLGDNDCKWYVLPLYNKGLDLLAGGKSAESIIKDSTSQLLSMYEELLSARQSQLRKSYDSPEVQKYGELKAEFEKFYEDNILSVLVATEQVKIDRVNPDGRLKFKPIDQKYYLSSLLSVSVQDIRKILGSGRYTY